MSRRRTSMTKEGFTLVEVIISASLGAVIMVGLWTVFDIFSALQERADRQSTRAQLTRGLLHQLQDDLNQVQTRPVRTSHPSSDHGLMPAGPQRTSSNLYDGSPNSSDHQGRSVFDGLGDPSHRVQIPSQNEAGNLSAIRNESAVDQADKQIAFFGSQSWLIMDLAQLSDGTKPETANSVAQLTGNPETVLPMRRVIYHFIAPEFAILNGSTDSGLTRWELSNPPTQIRELIEELDRGEWGTPNSMVWQTTDFSTAIVDVGEQSPLTSTHELVDREQVPEIKRFLFRYFDGENWRTTWDSRRDGSIPLAVECLLVWRDGREKNAVATDVETFEPTEIREELEEISLSSVWERLGQQGYTATSTRLPKGFGRYVFCLPAGLPPQRHLSNTAAISLGQL